jgi:hypothetical protein
MIKLQNKKYLVLLLAFSIVLAANGQENNFGTTSDETTIDSSSVNAKENLEVASATSLAQAENSEQSQPILNLSANEFYRDANDEPDETSDERFIINSIVSDENPASQPREASEPQKSNSLHLRMDEEEERTLEKEIIGSRGIREEIRKDEERLREEFEFKRGQVKSLEKEIMKGEVRQKIFEEIVSDFSGAITIIDDETHRFINKSKSQQTIIDIKLKRGEIAHTFENLNKKIIKKERSDEVLNSLQGDVTAEQLKAEIARVEQKIDEDIDGLEEKADELRRKYEATSRNMEIDKTASTVETVDDAGVKENLTVISLRIRTNRTLHNLSIYEEIPKSVASHIEEIIFFGSNFKVIEPDPLIVWQFATLTSDTEISYAIMKNLDTELLDEGKTIPVADEVGEEIKYTSFRIFFPFVMTFFIIIFALIVHRLRDR